MRCTLFKFLYFAGNFYSSVTKIAVHFPSIGEVYYSPAYIDVHVHLFTFNLFAPSTEANDENFLYLWMNSGELL